MLPRQSPGAQSFRAGFLESLVVLDPRVLEEVLFVRRDHGLLRLPTPARHDNHDDGLGLLGLREDVLAGDLADQVWVVGAQVPLRLVPELVVVLALDDAAAHTVDLLHGDIVGLGVTGIR